MKNQSNNRFFIDKLFCNLSIYIIIFFICALINSHPHSILLEILFIFYSILVLIYSKSKFSKLLALVFIFISICTVGLKTINYLKVVHGVGVTWMDCRCLF